MLKKENWTVTWKSAGITAGLFALTTVVCALLQRLGLNEISQLRNETYVPLVYVLCVLLVSLLTDGYLCGTVVSLLSVFAVNYVFTYPYMNFNFSLSGYPLTFFTMLAVSLTVNTLTATLKRQERIRMEAETERMRANLLRSPARRSRFWKTTTFRTGRKRSFSAASTTTPNGSSAWWKISFP